MYIHNILFTYQVIIKKNFCFYDYKQIVLSKSVIDA